MKISRQKAKDFLNTIDGLHSGGCLVSAFVFYLNEKRKGTGKNFQIVCLSNWEHEKNHNENYINGKEKNADSTNHFGWTFDGGKTIHDAKGMVRKSYYKYPLIVPKHLTEKFCISALNYGCWNDYFNRRVEIPKIAKFFELDLSMIKLKKYS